MIQDALARVIVNWRIRMGAPPVENSRYEQDPAVMATHQSFRRWVKLGGWLGLKLDLLAALSGTDKFGKHEYTPVYDALMRRHRKKAVTLLEIGVGGYSARLGGESLLMWEAYFPKGRIYAVDLVDKTAFSRGRIKVFCRSQTDREGMTALAREIGPLDFIIDDGSHNSADQIETFRILWPFLADGGVYIVEDVQTSYWPSFGGGGVGSRAYEESCMSFFKKMADSVNLAEFLDPPPENPRLEGSIGSVAFHHNLIVLTKDVNERHSNIPIHDERMRAVLTAAKPGADA